MQQEVTEAVKECVLLLQNVFLLLQNVFSYYRMCSLTTEHVLLLQNVFSYQELTKAVLQNRAPTECSEQGTCLRIGPSNGRCVCDVGYWGMSPICPNLSLICPQYVLICA